MTTALQPTTIAELQAMVTAARWVSVRGGGSKPALSKPPAGAVCIDLRRLSGTTARGADEFTYTACAGTPLQKVVDDLAGRAQYLPFDPLQVRCGATLGGTVAANLCGSGSYRYGGVRNFLVGVQFVDGRGRLVRCGGQASENAAGIDLPKFFVGSLGRYGILTEVSVRVFPRLPCYMTLAVAYPGLAAAQQAAFRLATEPLDLDALDLEPAEGTAFQLLVRVGGLEAGLPERMARLEAFLQGEHARLPQQLLLGHQESERWERINNLSWVPHGVPLLKVPLAPRQVVELDARIPCLARRYTAGGSVAWLALDDLKPARTVLTDMGLVGLRVLGRGGNPFVGVRRGMLLARRVKRALDPAGKFGEA
ncbi:MAG: FAD-binding oxidoreductase [Candidatus Anammoximicrobium sp.]|nr:FAD-binding oxidoreductase [Candidatus Anammoximicrobium sp.]